MQAQAADVFAFDSCTEPMSLGAFTTELDKCADTEKSVLHCFDNYAGPTTRHVVWGLFVDNNNTLLSRSTALLGKGDYSDVLARDVRIPINIKDALSDPTWAEHWRAALETEMKNMVDAKVWEVVRAPAGGVDNNFVDTKFVFKAKSNPLGGVDKFRVRLCARGFTQIHGLDYWQTFAPVVSSSTFRLQMCDAVQRGLMKCQIDFTGAFLQADIDGDIFLKLDSVCGVDVPPGYVIKLLKSLYGTKQAAFLWNEALTKELLLHGFRRSVADPSLFIRDDKRGYITMTTWVDDISVCYSNEAEWQKLYNALNDKYPIGEIKQLHWHLGMQITDGADYIEISLATYISEVIHRFGLSDANVSRCTTPMDGNKFKQNPLSKNDCPSTEAEKLDKARCPYRALLGCLSYISLWGRPDISTAISILARYQDNPGKRHWEALRHVAIYLKNTPDYCIRYQRDAPKYAELTGFVDADFANSDPDGYKSRTGYIFFCCGGPVVWRSTLQSLVAQSSCESELIALNAAAKEAEWLRVIYSELFLGTFDPVSAKPVTLFEDNTGAKALAETFVINRRSRHFRVRLYYVRQQVRDGVIDVSRVDTHENISDLFTKPLLRVKFDKFRQELVHVPMTSPHPVPSK